MDLPAKPLRVPVSAPMMTMSIVSGLGGGGRQSLQTGFFAVNQHQIAGIDHQTAHLPDEEGQAHLAEPDRVDEGDQPAADRDVPERHRHHALLGFLAVEQLDEEARGEEKLPEHADQEPHRVGRGAVGMGGGKPSRKIVEQLKLLRFGRAADHAALQPAYAEQVVDADQHAVEVGVFRRPVQARAVVHVDELARVPLAQHHRDHEAVQVIEIGQGQERLAPERLQAAAGIGGAVVEQALADGIGEPRGGTAGRGVLALGADAADQA